MSLRSGEWNVVVVGHWNRAILTPSGIAQRIFGLEKGTPVEVRVPIDSIGLITVKHDNSLVLADNSRVIVQPLVSGYSQLEQSLVLAVKAIESLQQTPFFGAGFNIRFKSTETSKALQNAVEHNYDERLSGIAPIAAWSYRRSLDWRGGRINLQVDRDCEGEYSILLNFDCQSTEVKELKKWLKTPIAEIQNIADQLIKDFLSQEIDETESDDDDTD